MWQHQLALKGGNMPRLFFALFFLSAPALANSVITIGTFTYLGPNSQGRSQYEIELNTNGVTAEPFTLVGVAIGSNNGGATFEIPTTADFDLTITGGGFGNCPCTSIFLSLGISPSGRPVTFLLANGTPFTAYALDTSTLLPLSGQFFIQPGQSVPITLTAVPEPGTALLIGFGLASLVIRRARSIIQRNSPKNYVSSLPT
jgi:hypothetical protein